jgi:hypothetical protein
MAQFLHRDIPFVSTIFNPERAANPRKANLMGLECWDLSSWREELSGGTSPENKVREADVGSANAVVCYTERGRKSRVRSDVGSRRGQNTPVTVVSARATDRDVPAAGNSVLHIHPGCACCPCPHQQRKKCAVEFTFSGLFVLAKWCE